MEVLEGYGVFVVLAEPGAGKTEFLVFLSRSLGVPPDRRGRHCAALLSIGAEC